MNNPIYIVSLEGKGDGSNNFTGFVRPGISVFTKKKMAVRAIYNYIKSEDLFEEMVDKEYEEDGSDIKYEEWYEQVLLERCIEIIGNGGCEIDDYRWIRVEKVEMNGETLNKHHYYKWEI